MPYPKATWRQPPRHPDTCGSTVTTSPQKSKESKTLIAYALSIPSRIAHSISYIPLAMTLAALVIAGSRCGVAELRSAKISSLEVRIWGQRCRGQQPHEALVNSGSSALDGAYRATSFG